MLFDDNDIISQFPNIKLSYENITHKIVNDSDIIIAIPFGRKCFVWFTEYKARKACFILELEQNKQITCIKEVHIEFSTHLINNTILYGTSFYYLKQNFFSVEDIFSYKDQNRINWGEKYICIADLIKKDGLYANLHRIQFSNA
jgi:hypothetical protein